jgi:hypothetical protein
MVGPLGAGHGLLRTAAVEVRVEQGHVITSEPELVQLVLSLRTVAVVGMKDETEPESPAYRIPGMMKARGIRVIPVNPKLTRSLGEPAYPALAQVPDRFDAVQIFRRPEAVGGLAEEILALPSERRPRAVWMQTGIRNEGAARSLSEAGLLVVMDRCLGVEAAKYRPVSLDREAGRE